MKTGLTQKGIVRIGISIGLWPLKILWQGGAAADQEQRHYADESNDISLANHARFWFHI